jgi:hypothetical protein
LVLSASLAYGCGSDDGADSKLPQLPFEHPASDGGELDGSVSKDAGADATKPITKRDGSAQGDSGDPLTDDNACAATSVAAQQVVVTEQVPVTTTIETPAPVALYIMFDNSMSMGGPPWGAANIWPAAVSAIKSFVNDTSSAGIDVALQYFPSGGQCGGAGYNTPAVALGRLPARAAGIASSLDNHSANGLSTPTEGALRGATQFCTTFQAAHSDEKCIAVLVTDGEPNGCDGNADHLATIASDAFAAGVRTFTVGLNGADFTLLDKIAKAGGAADCDPNSARFSCDVSASADKLSEALGKIRESVKTTVTHTETVTKTETHPLDCTWVMPTPTGSDALDKDRVNVTLSGQQTLALGRVPTVDKCQDGAWYYDNNDAPTQINACPTTCDAIKAGTYTDVKILLGCESKYIMVY